jgi:hypothetical protein
MNALASERRRARGLRRRCRHDRSKKSGIGYNFRLRQRIVITMEAERVNQINASLEGLRKRTADLRRYL